MKKRRLFVTTGLISVLNCLTVIEQIGKKQDYDDILIIFFTSKSQTFIDQHNALLGSNFFKEIYYKADQSDVEDIKNTIGDNFDIVVIVNHSTLTAVFFNLYNNSRFYLTEEGIGSYFTFDNVNWNIVEKVYIHNYLGKITFVDLPTFIKKEILDVNVFRKICLKLSEKLDLQIDFSSSDKKRILITGQQFLIMILKTNSRIIEYYSGLIEKLLFLNFDVFYKSHPREDDKISSSLKNRFGDSVTIVDNKLPLEICNNNFTAIFSPISGTTITMSHIWDAPTLCDFFKKSYRHNFFHIKEYASCLLIINKFIPNIEFVFQNIKKEMTHDQALLKINNARKNNVYSSKRTDLDSQIRKRYKSDCDGNNFVLDWGDRFFVNFLCSFILFRENRKLFRKQMGDKLIKRKRRQAYISKRVFKLFSNGTVKYPFFKY